MNWHLPTFLVTLFCIFVFSLLFYPWNGASHYNTPCINHTINNCKCDKAPVISRNCTSKMNLPVFDKSHSEILQVFFLETSGRPYLNGRQVCSIESAAIQSGLTPKVIMKSSYIDLSKRKSFCDLFYDYKNVQFYTIDYEELFRNTPVDGLSRRLDHAAGGHKFTHYSDIGRLAIVYKYGGFYLDLDVIVTKDMRHLTSFLVIEMNSTTRTPSDCRIPEASLEDFKSLHNGEFRFPPRHEFLRRYMESANRTYNEKWNSRNQVGPQYAYHVANRMYKTRLTNKMLDKEIANRHVTLLPDFTFLPVVYHQVGSILWSGEPKSPQQWDDIFRCSYTVHFFSHYNDHRKVSGDPSRDAYSYLGPTHCPKAFRHYKDEF